MVLEQTRYVGQRIPMIEGPAKVSGTGRYVSDVSLPGMLHGAILRSPHPYADIVSIDTSAARQLPGVHAVITAADASDEVYIHLGGPASDRHVMARDRVRFIGEEVAAVAAETLELARQAAELIKVEYRPLRPVFDPVEAMRESAPEIHPLATYDVEQTNRDDARLHRVLRDERNVSVHTVRRWGDLEAAFAASDLILEHEFHFPQETHVTMEPDGTVVSYDPVTGRYDVWTSTQSPYFIEKEMAHMLGVDRRDIHVHEVLIGGGFGGKSKICEHEVITALLALQSGRPVKLMLTRDEQFATTKTRHAFRTKVRTGVSKEGRVLARQAEVIVDNGAYNATGPAVMGFAGLVAGSLYQPQAALFDARLVYTNKTPGGQFRGYGNPQITFAIESQMDIIAAELGIDPVELRRRNLNQAGQTTLAGWVINSCGFEECLDAVADALGWENRGRVPNRGMGIAAMIHCTGANIYQDGDFSEADVEATVDGQVIYRTGLADPGTWQNTALAQMVADTLGVPFDRVKVVTMDSDDTPEDLGTWGSRVTFVGGNAARRAAAGLRTKLCEAAAQAWEASPSDVSIVEGVIGVQGDPSHRMELGEAVALSPHTVDGVLREHERYATPTEQINRVTGVANISAAYSFAVQGVEVEVDPTTGTVKVLRVVAAHDVGRAINPIAVEGQIEGAVAMGLGAALSEELIWEQGKMINGSYLFYGIPRASDLPQVEDHVVEAPDPEGPFGAKGVGESGLVPTSAAVANAVADAIGSRVMDLPITPDKVLAALAERPPRTRPLWQSPRRWQVALTRALYPGLVLPLLHRFGTRWARRRPLVTSVEVTVPSGLEEAIAQAAGAGAEIIGGGTDVMPRRSQRLSISSRLVDVSGLSELGGIELRPEGLRLGAAVTLGELAASGLVAEQAPLIGEVVGQIAGEQVRNVATVAGNLCQEKRCWFYRQGLDCYKRGGWTCPCYAVVGDNRFYHAVFDAHRCQAVGPSDLAVALAALDGYVRTVGPGGAGRRLDMAGLYSGPGETVLRPGEVIVEAVVPVAWLGAAHGYEKLRLREGDFPIASAAVTRSREGRCRVVLGGVAEKPRRNARSEAAAESGRSPGEVAALAVYDAFPLPGNKHKVAMAQAVTAAAVRTMRGRLTDAEPG